MSGGFLSACGITVGLPGTPNPGRSLTDSGDGAALLFSLACRHGWLTCDVGLSRLVLLRL